MCLFFGAVKRIRTADLFLTKEVLCLLSYNSECNELFQGSVRRNASSEKAYAFNCEAIRQVLITASCFKLLFIEKATTHWIVAFYYGDPNGARTHDL